MNTMGAFYSGTDDNNDKNGIYYSGVVGKITPTSYDWVMRFNLHNVKRKVPLHEIFDMQEEKVEVPKAWLDQVQLRTYRGPATNHSTQLSESGGSTHISERLQHHHGSTRGRTPYQNGAAFWSAQRSISDGEQDGQPRSFPTSQDSLWDQEAQMRDELSAEFDRRFPGTSNSGSRNGGQKARHQRRIIDEIMSTEGISEEELREINDELAAAHYIAQGDGTTRKIYVPGKPGNLEDSISDERILNGPSQIEVSEVDRDIDVTDEDDGELFHFELVSNYDEIVINYGEDCANAYSMIDHYITDMEGYDEGLHEVIRTAYNLLSASGQAKIQQNGLG